VIGRDKDEKPIGAKDIVPVSVPLTGPSSHRWRADKTISSGCNCGGLVLAERDPEDVWCVWLKHNCSAITVKDKVRVLGESGLAAEGGETNDERNPGWCDHARRWVKILEEIPMDAEKWIALQPMTHVVSHR
jgi:hypothetical protein